MILSLLSWLKDQFRVSLPNYFHDRAFDMILESNLEPRVLDDIDWVNDVIERFPQHFQDEWGNLSAEHKLGLCESIKSSISESLDTEIYG